jgi:hypothetical protein
MQFGKLHGLLFMVLGVVLLASQTWMSFGDSKPVDRTPQEITQPEHKLPPIAGVMGALSLVGGLFLYATNRRSMSSSPDKLNVGTR